MPLLLAGCSALRVAYNQGPELMYWWADGYLDFERGQSPQVKAALHDWFAWHRRAQLPVLAERLGRARTEVLADTTPERVCAWGDEVRDLARQALEQGVPAAATLLPLLKPDNLQRLERKFRQRDEEFRREYLQPTAAERDEAAFQRSLEQAQRFYGRLDEPQRQVLAEGLKAAGFEAPRWRAELQLRREHLLAQLRALQAGGVPPARREAVLRELVAENFQSPRAEYRTYAVRWREGQCQAWARLHNATTPAQRRQAAEHLHGWEQDARALAAQPLTALRAAPSPAVD